MGWIAIALCCTAVLATDDNGVIEGVVVNGTRDQEPVPDAVVILRADHQGALVSLAQTTTDESGFFRFEQVPLTDKLTYLPGANYQGIHYPGNRINIDGRRPALDQKIVVYDTVSEPNPLIVSRHQIEVRPDSGVLVVTETIVVANRTKGTYVGSEMVKGGGAVTLRLSIPPEFEKVTFDKEFFGRQFQLNEQRLETQVPWPPGSRQLKFTYRLPIEGRHWLFSRPLDLPTEHIRITVTDQHVEDVTCNLVQQSASLPDTVVFESDGTTLPAGHAIALELGSLPVPWTTYARWGAVAGLAILLLGTSAIMFRRRGSVKSGECAHINRTKQRRAA